MGIDYLLFLQNIRESMPALASIMNAVTHLGGSTISVVLIAVIYWCISKRTGVRIGMALSIGNITNLDSRIVPDPGAIEGATGYSFPSGHSQNAMSIYGTIAADVNKRIWKILIFLVAFIVAFSRNFLGVHTPRDVVAGLAVGFVGVVASGILLDWLEAGENRDLLWAGVMIAITVAFLAYTSLKPYEAVYDGSELLVDPEEMIADCYKVAGVIFGICIGWPCERRWVRFTTEVSARTKIFRGIAGVVLVAAANFACKSIGAGIGIWAAGFIESFVPVIIVILIWPMIFTLIEKRM
mgnify:CR=1 FL=1